MGNPLRKPNDTFPESGSELGDIVPRDLGGTGEAPKPNLDRPDPSLFDEGPQDPAVGNLPGPPSLQETQTSSLQETSPQGPSPVKNQQRRNRRGGFSFTLVIFGAIGMLAFGAGASLAYFILSGALDVDHSWIKENLSFIKNLIKEWRS